MTQPIRVLATLISLIMVLGVAPAMADEGEDTDGATTEEEAPEGEGHLNGKFLILFAEGFEGSAEDVESLATLGLGFGEIFKLNLYSAVLGVSIEDLIAGATFDAETGEYDFAWGELKKSLTDEQLAALATMPKNLGQLVSEHKRHQGRDEHQPDHAGRDADKLANDNKPDHAGRGGRSGK